MKNLGDMRKFYYTYTVCGHAVPLENKDTIWVSGKFVCFFCLSTGQN